MLLCFMPLNSARGLGSSFCIGIVTKEGLYGVG